MTVDGAAEVAAVEKKQRTYYRRDKNAMLIPTLYEMYGLVLLAIAVGVGSAGELHVGATIVLPISNLHEDVLF
jgi:hypothetical protein